MEDQHAQPGDIIEISVPGSDLNGKRITVVETPSGETNRYPGQAWIYEREYETHVGPGFYTIVQRKNPRVTQNNDVDKSLDRQRDDQLRSLFGFD